MRKRVVIGLLAVAAIVAIAMGARLLSQPKKGSVEWHKREYLRAHAMPSTWRGVRYFVQPGFAQPEYWNQRARRIHFHRQALLESGYLTEREFVVSNRPAQDVAEALLGSVELRKDYPFVCPMWIETNVVAVIARPGEMDKVGKWIREADVRESAE
jgi:hypothetical protein